ncbi:MAG: BRO family protein [Cyanobacteria bacterium P01_D01_bin.56]
MPGIILFNFESHDIRYVGDGVKHEWVATDICSALNIKNPSQALDRLEDDEKGICLNETPGGEQELLTVNEPGMYELVFGSRKPEAKRFKRWLKHEVLPAIRKTGSYTLRKADPTPEVAQLPSRSISEIDEFATVVGKRFGPHVEESCLILNLRRHCPDMEVPQIAATERTSLPSSQALLTATQIAEELGITCKTNSNPSPQGANKLLANLGYQYKVGKGRDSQWTPTEKGEPLCDRKFVDTNSKSDKFQLLWKASIINELRS